MIDGLDSAAPNSRLTPEAFNSDDVFAAAGLTTSTPAHWKPITRTQDFEAQQKATRARLADTYEPGQSERTMLQPGNIDLVWLADTFAVLVNKAAEFLDKWAGLAVALEPEPDKYAHMTPRARALAMKNDRAHAKGIEGTKKARNGGLK
jgi:hypothetical protein